MAFFTPYLLTDIILLVLTIIISFFINFKLRSRKYWAKRNFPYKEPRFLFGNTAEANRTKSIQQVFDEIYFKHKDKQFLGIWTYTKPCLLVNDLEAIKNILVKDFAHFHDRGLVINEELEPLTAHLFNMAGQPWRNLRVKLTPTFTSGKMKMMYDTMYDVGVELQKILEKHAAKKSTIEVKEILACFTTDVISSCAFGIKSNAMEDPSSDFRKYGRQVFDPPLANIICGIIQFVAPELAKTYKLRQFPKQVSDFFMKTVKDVISYRESTSEKRKDFMELLIQLKNKGRIEDADHKYDDVAAEQGGGDPFTLEQAAAQAFVFFFAGFETSSSTMMLALYELALNPDIQEKLQQEIDLYMGKENGNISYNVLMEMEYLDKVIQETLRKHPVVPMLFRECTKDYPRPEQNMTMVKGDFLVIPISAIQNDPEYFPDPDRFDPERHSPEARAGRDSILNLAFGAGPRICIGMRFGVLQVKVGLALILSKYKLDVSEKTPIPLDYDPRMFFPSPKNGMPLRISKR